MSDRVRLRADDPKFVDRLKHLSEQEVSELSNEDLLKLCSILAPPAGKVVQYAQAVEWIIPDLLPRGALILVGGEPKVAKKTLLLLHLAKCVSDTTAQELFLGDLDVRVRGQSVVINLEDGRDRLLRRLKHFGLKSGDPRPLHAMWRAEGLPVIHEWLRRSTRPAKVIVVDPLVELGVELSAFDENVARDMARLLKTYRDIAQHTGAAVLIVHHFRKQGDRMRGSSALEGACDGWWNIRPDGKHLRLQIEMRDGPECEISYDVRYEDEHVTIQAISELRDGHSKVKARTTKATETVDDIEPAADLQRVVNSVLAKAEYPLSKSEIAKRSGKNTQKVRAYLNQRIEDGFILCVGNPKRPKLVAAEDADRLRIQPEDIVTTD